MTAGGVVMMGKWATAPSDRRWSYAALDTHLSGGDWGFLVAADFISAGLVDVGNKGAVLLTKGDGTLVKGPTFSAGGGIVSLAAGHFADNGLLGLVVGSDNSTVQAFPSVCH